MNPGRVNLVVAHQAEAQPLIESLHLKRRAAGRLRVYDHGGVCLVISGMGRAAASQAVHQLAALQVQDDAASVISAWLNVGIAGHQRLELGQSLLASKLTEQASGRSWYPAVMMPGFQASEVITVDEPEQDYPQLAAYEMEASGFFAAASRQVSLELVQVCKVISDNPSHPTSAVDLPLVRRLVAEQADAVAALCRQLQELAAEYDGIYGEPAYFQRLRSAVRCSVTQTSQLKRLCQRYSALGLTAELEQLARRPPPTSRQLINSLNARLARLP